MLRTHRAACGAPPAPAAPSAPASRCARGSQAALGAPRSLGVPALTRAAQGCGRAPQALPLRRRRTRGKADGLGLGASVPHLSRLLQTRPPGKGRGPRPLLLSCGASVSR